MASRHEDASLATVERCPLAGLVIDLAQVDRFPPDLLRRHRFLPHAVEEGVLLVATAQVADPVLADEIAFITGLPSRLSLATGGDLVDVLEAALGALRRGDARFEWTGTSEAEIGSDLVSLDLLPAVGPAARGLAARPKPTEPDPGGVAPISLPSLPAAALRAVAVAEPAPVPAPRTGPASGLTAALLAPSTGVLAGLEETLASLGFLVTREPASAETYLQLEQRSPDVIVATDLPAGEGHVLDQCAELRRHLGPDRGVIVIAREGAGGWRRSEDLLRVLGIDACLGLPLDHRLLLWSLERALRARLGRTVALLERPGASDAESWLAKGTERYRRGELGPAIEAFERGLARDPDHVALLGSLAVARVKQGQIFAAADSLERALALDPGQVTVARNLAQLYERRGFRYQAIETWERALMITTEAERRQEILRHLEELWRA